MQAVTTWSVQCLTWEKDSAVYSCLTKRWLCLAQPSFYRLVIFFFSSLFLPAHLFINTNLFKKKCTLYCKFIVVYLLLFCPWLRRPHRYSRAIVGCPFSKYTFDMIYFLLSMSQTWRLLTLLPKIYLICKYFSFIHSFIFPNVSFGSQFWIASFRIAPKEVSTRQHRLNDA